MREQNCDLCGLTPKKQELVYLNLFVIGSEGVVACLGCRLILTRVAEGIRSQCGKVRHELKKQSKD